MIVEVKDKKADKIFLNLPNYIYKNDPCWIAPLNGEIASVFQPDKNNFFHNGACNRWILLNEQQQPVGRIAAFIQHQKPIDLQAAGGIGFFECINDHQAASCLFDTAKNWLQSQGRKAMDGPINFGENDKFWGLLVEGFKDPSFGMNYNPPYYRDLFESYGFIKLYDQFTNVLDAQIPLPERFTKISDWVMSKKEYSFEHFTSANREKYFHDFQEVYNDAWIDFENFHSIKIETIRESFRQMKPIMDEKIIWFAYHNNEPIAFILCMPDANQILKHLNGSMHLVNKLKFLWYKHTKTIDRLRIIVMGCKQKFQNHGIESALIRCLQKEVLPRNTIREVELAWVGDFNKKMRAIHEATGATLAKVHRTYRYVFDT